MPGKRQKDLEFHVDVAGSTKVFDKFDRAVETAAIMSIGTGVPVGVDVVAWSEAAARAFGGDDGVESYREDPEASVFRRFTVQMHDLGRIA
jgi:hypothetical protein